MTGLGVQLLGPVRLRVGPRQVLLPANKPRAIAALLALSGGRPVSTWRLVDGIWGQEPPASVTNALQVHIAALRRACREAGFVGDPVVRDGDAYLLSVDESAVDVADFETVLSAAPAQEQLERILALWSGDALADIDAPFTATVRTRLHERRAEARERLASACIEAGRGRKVIPMLRQAVEDDPLREPLVAALMRALWQAGDQAAALNAFEHLRHRLDEELGVFPGGALARLHGELLRQEPLAPAEPPTAPARRPQASTQHLSPRDEFVGRETELAALRSMLSRASLVTVTGPGGVGKTRLVQELLRQDAGESAPFRYVALEDLTSAEEVLPAVGGSIGVELHAAGPRPVDAISIALAAQPGLLVLDNLDHLLDVGPELDELLRLTPGLTLLVTCRGPLGLPGEVCVPLGPLGLPTQSPAGAVPPAVQLLLSRARRHGVVLEPTSQVNELCEAVDGLPLGLELLAGRLATTPAAVLLEDLRAAVSLGGPEPGRPARHRSLAAAVAGSYDALDPSSRAALHAAATFRGSWTKDDLTAVSGQDDRAALDGLVRQHLVQLEDESGHMRLLRTVRTFVRERVDASDLAQSQRQVDVLMLRKAAAHAAGWPFGDLSAASVADLRTAAPDLRAALEVALADGGAAVAVLASAYVAVLRADGDSEAVAAIVRRVAALPELPVEIDVHSVLLLLAQLEDASGDLTGATGTLDLLAREAAPDPATSARARAVRAGVLRKAGDPQGAIALFEHVSVPALCELVELGRAHLTLGSFGDAEELLVAALHQAEGAGPDGVAALVQLARVRVAKGDAVGAIGAAQRARHLLDTLGDRRAQATALRIEGGAHELAGDLDRAAAMLDEGAELARRCGDVEELGGCLINLGLVEMRRDRLAEAVRCDDEAVELFTRIGHRAGAAIASANLAEKLVLSHDAYSAVMHAERAVALAEAIDDRLTSADARLTWARALVILGRLDEARALAVLAARDAAASDAGDLLAAAERLAQDPTTASEATIVTHR